MVWYFNNVPIYLQSIVSPIDSAYLSCAILKILTQLLLIYLFYAYIKGKRKIDFKDFILISIISIPFFQTYGYQATIGIINAPITYFCFYSLIPVLFLVPFTPFFFKIFHENNTNFSLLLKITITSTFFILSLTSSLVPSISMIVCPLILFSAWQKLEGTITQKVVKLLKSDYLLLIILLFFSTFSFYIGTFNSENFGETIPITERYKRIPKGLFFLFTVKLGLSLLILMLFINTQVIKKHLINQESTKILKTIKWIAAIAIIYILLLPLGGYRIYRPNIVGKDVLTPIIILLIFGYVMTTYHIVNSSFKHKKSYIGTIILISIIYTAPDFSDYRDYKCERDAFEQIFPNTDDMVQRLLIQLFLAVDVIVQLGL